MSWNFWHPPWPTSRARPVAVPDELDFELVEIVCDVIATETSCARCRALLGRAIVAALVQGPSTDNWSLDVVTVCRGRRRHLHQARVSAEPDGDLVFGDFHR